MKQVSTRRHLLIGLSAATLLGLAACGGGGGGSDENVANWAEVSGSSAITELKTTDTTAGTGAEAVDGKKLNVRYTGWLYDKRVATTQKGSQFDSNTTTGIPFILGAGEVIKGWDQGVKGMKVGGKRTLLIPASLAYGSTGKSIIPGGAALIFEVELVSVQ
jgi:FKBP-type peptidyl-prolyl cis-trans isomerase